MHRSGSHPLVVVFLLAVTAGALATANQQAPSFSSANRTVAVYATVTDAGGRLVPDLERASFEVADNNKHQELTLFANDVQPITVVVLLDRSGSMRANFELVEQAAEQFVNAMLPADQARIGSFSNRIQVDPRDFTSDHDELIKILRTELQPEGPTPLWNAVNVGITALLHQQGRRVVLVFTDGVDMPMNFSSNNSSLKFIGMSTPSVKTSTTRRPCWCSSAVMPTFTAFHSGVGPSGCSSVRRILISSSWSDVKSRGSTWMRVAKLPMRALSAGSIALTNSSAACSTSSKFARMLPLRSSSTTTVIGWTSFANSVSSWCLLLSATSKLARSRSGTRRPPASVTVAYTATVRFADEKLGA